jgi:hypothetical protein
MRRRALMAAYLSQGVRPEFPGNFIDTTQSHIIERGALDCLSPGQDKWFRVLAAGATSHFARICSITRALRAPPIFNQME